MSVPSKFSSLSVINPPTHSRVGLNGCSPTGLSIFKIQQHKQKQTH